VGDVLLLTKPLGTGILATAGKQGQLGTEDAERLYASMCALNGTASRAALAVGSRCATDITGFGLLGHAHNIAEASRVTIVVHADRLPVLPGTEDAWRRGVRTGGAERNSEYLESRVDWGAASDFARDLAIDPQTSGGMLVAVAAPRVEEYLSLVPSAVAIGEVVARRSRALVLA
jgi:selenide, water dikinase